MPTNEDHVINATMNPMNIVPVSIVFCRIFNPTIALMFSQLGCCTVDKEDVDEYTIYTVDISRLADRIGITKKSLKKEQNRLKAMQVIEVKRTRDPNILIWKLDGNVVDDLLRADYERTQAKREFI